ncbi:sugar ABC transporter substrate-binding protein [Pengzhenrongella sicca]|uniref:Sugar ABC transporter substrate-binding protein n=1 Tax=Pengzhenrongella sicca TaxID=2819238 RepID=A0A8A4ZFG6_9MICO|nr:sugar ABC transporter substrate-binding protein [Pengzhenrongella sicca]QTE29663.1 sugar ABC transporter substrate-binding protein [Pengzhenrongella sicca]
MRKPLRVTVATLAAATTLIALTSCGRSDDAPAEDMSAAPVAEGEATGTITVWAMGTEGEKLGEFADAFSAENPDATVEVTAIPWDAAHDKIATAIAADQTPDVSMVGTTWMGEFASTGALDPTPDTIDGTSFFPGAWGTTIVNDVAYGMPWYVETRVLYTNTAAAEAAGVSPSPATWDDLKTSTAAIQAAGADYGITLQAGQQGAWQTFMPFAWQAGAQILDDEGNITLDTPEVVDALTYYQSFFTDGVAPVDVPVGTLESSLIAGEFGAMVSGPWHIGILEEAGYADFTLSPLPAGEQLASFIGGSNLAVFKNAENRDGAWKFIEWLSQPDTQAAWYEATSDLPSVPEAWETGTLATDPQLAIFGTQLETAVAPPSIPNWEQIATVIDTELEKVTRSGLDPQEAATAIQQQAEAIGTGL